MGRICAVVVLCACAHGSAGGSGGDSNATFEVTYPDASGATAKVGKRFYAKPVAHCRYDNGHDARWTMGGAKVVSGELPPGLTFEDGVVGGVPNKAGEYQARIELSNVECAGKPYTGQGADIHISVK